MSENEDKLLEAMKLLEEMLAKAEGMGGSDTRLHYSKAGWSVFVDGRPYGSDSVRVTAEAALADLRKLATPPKPATVIIEVPYEVAKGMVTFWNDADDSPGKVAVLCREAIKPYEEPQA